MDFKSMAKALYNLLLEGRQIKSCMVPLDKINANWVRLFKCLIRHGIEVTVMNGGEFRMKMQKGIWKNYFRFCHTLKQKNRYIKKDFSITDV